MNKATCFLFESFLRERAGKGAEVSSRDTGMGLRIEIKGAEIERGHLEGWLRGYFQHFEMRNFPLGFFVHGRRERFVVTVSANREFTSKVPLSSFVTIQQFQNYPLGG